MTNPLARSLRGGTGLPRLDTSGLRATWLADCARLIGLATFLRAGGITCTQRLGDIIATLEPGGEAEAVALLGGTMRGQRAAVSIPLAVLEDIIDSSGVAPAIEALIPARARHRQLPVRTLLAGMMLTLDDPGPRTSPRCTPR